MQARRADRAARAVGGGDAAANAELEAALAASAARIDKLNLAIADLQRDLEQARATTPDDVAKLRRMLDDAKRDAALWRARAQRL